MRRSKLYYLRQRSGKSARISEKNTFVKNKEKNENIGDKKLEGEKSTAKIDNNESKTIQDVKKVPEEKK